MQLGIILAIAAVLSITGCNRAARKFVTPFELPNHHWRQVYRDSLFEVSLDTTNIELVPDGDDYRVWHQTRHLVQRYEKGKAWNREVILGTLRCNPLSFITVRTTIFQDHGAPVAQQAPDERTLATQSWKPIQPGSVDEGALKGACTIIQGRHQPARP